MNRIERNQLVIDNLPLVGYLVSELCARATHLSRDDLASVGAIGLITAAESFDSSLGIPFGAFARKRITGAFADELRAGDWASRGTRKRIKETLLVQDSLTASLGRSPSVDEIAAALGVDRDTAAEAMADASRTVTTLDDMTADTMIADTALPEESLLEEERTAYLRAAVEALPEKMRHIVTAVYFDDRPVKEIAEELGITHSAVSQQRSEAIRLLRDGLGTHYSDNPDAEYEAESRVSAASRNAYLARLANQAVAGMSRMVAGPIGLNNTVAS
ncbi:RNA polymerase sigma factor for flagellar operon FliA [Homoserinimonas aerilata]|uniref:RNA polymerase sigma factor for flagellar operon FliA n=1 Tax=Homoserinimonas aerilata TaxID=1162970 RepID=A0A542YES8_9MICO|nr:sigma-70 family RNA polymerase sigma factor [Homoserinimonas aerilata]TQL46603.1 RNA polymerase sigma factor for flagellar operon FliA [Homoserinimonas aerilata]